MQQWRVRDVMNANVVTATDDAPFGEIIEILAHHRISGVPIVNDVDRVLGVVSQADLLPKIEFAAPTNGRRGLRRWFPSPAKATARVARDLMTAPALTIAPDASLATAAKLMHTRNVKRLLVADKRHRLLGVVSRTDLLRVYSRPDEAIRHDVTEHILRKTLWLDRDQVQVHVNDGQVTLTGTLDRRTTAGIALRLTHAVPGVVDVVDRLGYDFDDTALARSRVHRSHPFSAAPFGPS